MADENEEEKKEAEDSEEEEQDSEGEESDEESDSEEGDEEGEEGDGKKKKKKKKGKPSKLKLIILAVILVVAIAVPAVLYLTGFFEKQNENVSYVEGEEDGEPVVNEDGVVERSVYYDMEEFIVNLNVGSTRPSFLKMTVSLELAGESQIPRVEEKMPRIRDSFQIYLRELRQEDLQGSAGLYRLREELLLRINKIVYPAKINDILFKEILVQ